MTESSRTHVHILGICGTFMGGIAAIAKASGYRVTGADANVYPPMSTQLRALGIELHEGYDAGQLDPKPDIVIVGNALSRGSPVIEAMLDRGMRYSSGPQWLAEEVLQGRHVLAVAGTHGKTTTSSMLAWILDVAGLQPGFLIGGVALGFDTTARLGSAPYFVIEADEYDTAFFDKRAKFVHYRPRTAILNNLEYDHADIYADVAAIRRQFHLMLRAIPHAGRLIVNGDDAELAKTLDAGCWTPADSFGTEEKPRVAHPAFGAHWHARLLNGSAGRRFSVLRDARVAAEVEWGLLGRHNVQNGLAAIAAAATVGVEPELAAQALCEFKGVKRRMEIRGTVDGITVYDDFAHHPTAIESTLQGLRADVGRARILAVLEPRSNTMKLGIHRQELVRSLEAADEIWVFEPEALGWDLRATMSALEPRVFFRRSIDAIAADLAQRARSGDHILVMSNGGFGGLHEKLLDRLRVRTA